MSARTLPDRRTVLRGSVALIASAAMFSPHLDPVSAGAATARLHSTASSTATAAVRRRVPVGLL